MPNSLDPIVTRFLSLDATPSVRALLLGAIAEADGNSNIEKQHFEFNVFDVEVNFAASTVSVAEVLSTMLERPCLCHSFARRSWLRRRRKRDT